MAGLAGRTLQVLPAETLSTRRADGARQPTALHLAEAFFGQDLIPQVVQLLFELMERLLLLLEVYHYLDEKEL